ncbi:hypothetical protein ACFWYW_23830 [Nonomuraea sp. NPDC059023]|uniref:hypothetical protein n=1 Tax=unclassified Nonomuraea TaxID=2593643 RepID=UPI00367EAF10
MYDFTMQDAELTAATEGREVWRLHPNHGLAFLVAYYAPGDGYIWGEVFPDKDGDGWVWSVWNGSNCVRGMRGKRPEESAEIAVKRAEDLVTKTLSA